MATRTHTSYTTKRSKENDSLHKLLSYVNERNRRLGPATTIWRKTNEDAPISLAVTGQTLLHGKTLYRQLDPVRSPGRVEEEVRRAGQEHGEMLSQARLRRPCRCRHPGDSGLGQPYG